MWTNVTRGEEVSYRDALNLKNGSYPYFMNKLIYRNDCKCKLWQKYKKFSHQKGSSSFGARIGDTEWSIELIHKYIQSL